MTTDANKALVRRFYDALNTRDLALLDELYTNDFVSHGGMGIGTMRGLDSLKQVIGLMLTAMPDLKFTIEALIAERDEVVVRGRLSGTHQGDFFGIAPTGKQVSWTDSTIYRIADDRLAERWFNDDQLSLLQQLGAIPAA